MGGSVSEMFGRHKNFTSWCELGDVVRSVTWLYAKLDSNWEFEMNQSLSSILSSDRKRLSLHGSREAPSDSFSLYLDATGPDAFTCGLAQWQRHGEETSKGTCTVMLTKLAAENGEYDEGTFSAHFELDEGGYKRRIELTDGKFRLRRQ